MTLKILSDFDGVWTDQVFEAEQVKLHLAAEAARLADVEADDAFAEFREFEARVLAAPEHWGWAPDGRITAYVDEDPLCAANSIAMYLERAKADVRTQRYREAILDAGFASLTAFADQCFHTATISFRQMHPPALVPRARLALEALHRAGASVVIVSNSTSDRIVNWFRQAGIDAGESASHVVRVRGSAGKQTLGASDEHLMLAGRKIHVDRPRYAAVLAEERPDVVIGDVFSLDLALPHVMRTKRDAAAPRELVLRRHPHTPPWVLETRADGAIDVIVDGVVDLLAIVDRRAKASRR